MSKCSPRPCELPRIKMRHRQCVVCCKWCQTLYIQDYISYGIDGYWTWTEITLPEAKQRLGFQKDGKDSIRNRE